MAFDECGHIEGDNCIFFFTFFFLLKKLLQGKLWSSSHDIDYISSVCSENKYLESVYNNNNNELTFEQNEKTRI